MTPQTMEMLGVVMDVQQAKAHTEAMANKLKEVDRRSKARKDYIAERSAVRVVDVDGALHAALPGEDTLYRFRDVALKQFGASLDVPWSYTSKLLDKGYRDLLVHDLNTLAEREPRRLLWRTLDGEVDAVLSDAYQAIDSRDLLLVLAEARKSGLAFDFWDVKLTRDEVRFGLVSPSVIGEVNLKDAPGGYRWRADREGGGKLFAAAQVRNGETGQASLDGWMAALDAICCNFNLWGKMVSRIHVGRRNKDEGLVDRDVSVQAATTRLIVEKVRALVSNTFDPAKFQAALDAKMAEMSGRTIDKPLIETVTAALKLGGVSEEHREAVLAGLFEAGGEVKTAWDLASALTEVSGPKRGAGLDDATRIAAEDAAAEVFGMTDRDWSRFLASVEV